MIFEYPEDLWIIEVKHHYCGADDIFLNPRKDSAVDQLNRYRDRIRDLKWWQDRRIHLAVFWSVNPSDLDKIELPPSSKYCKYWPEIRIPVE